MNLIPEWAPSIHPMLVHFPIALLFTAVMIDLAAMIMPRKRALHTMAVGIYSLGALGALASLLTGRIAADAVLIPTEANALLTDHADWATWTVWFFGLYGIGRLAIQWLYRKESFPRSLWIPVFLLGAGGLVLVQQTAERGAQMVFQQGVGVVAAEKARLAEEHALLTAAAATNEAGPHRNDEGGWAWRPTRAAAWKEKLTWLEGDPTDVGSSLVALDDGSEVLALSLSGKPVFFVFDQPLESTQTDVLFRIGDFKGSIRIVSNAQGAQDYMFLELTDGQMRQGLMLNGHAEILDADDFSPAPRERIRNVVDQTHFRAYSSSRLVTHGHGSAPVPGSVGLRLEGSGTLYLDAMLVQPLRPVEHDEGHEAEHAH